MSDLPLNWIKLQPTNSLIPQFLLEFLGFVGIAANTQTYAIPQ